MPVPKKRMSQTRTNKRRSHHSIKNVESILHGNSHRLKKFLALDKEVKLISTESKK